MDSFSTYYVMLSYELMLEIDLCDLPEEQHCDYHWFTVDELLSSNQVHQHTKDYFR
ncbi:hypothetical protein [Endozoicomonas sp. GU-1]|uniref:hypothetical protein n=1 Tax=Endozoicomonas sp. GU-1 TaxID=3009078 RepID=UPI0022B5093E|nr:hypothetical protein [Endozoicomonas sp. GU-1]WBA82425.1 hypothetical protein O2T12_04555 [Endozoicomonas sp. GU-1]WBA85359.1 hypothetical protein O3276_19235 [Endozoicomonas sp. GU-1]